jgi:hypothetical protein
MSSLKKKAETPLRFTRHVEHQNRGQPSQRDERSWIEFQQQDIKFDRTDGTKNRRRDRSGKKVLPTAIRTIAFGQYDIWKICSDFDQVCLRLQESKGFLNSRK